MRPAPGASSAGANQQQETPRRLHSTAWAHRRGVPLRLGAACSLTGVGALRAAGGARQGQVRACRCAVQRQGGARPSPVRPPHLDALPIKVPRHVAHECESAASIWGVVRAAEDAHVRHATASVLPAEQQRRGAALELQGMHMQASSELRAPNGTPAFLATHKGSPVGWLQPQRCPSAAQPARSLPPPGAWGRSSIGCAPRPGSSRGVQGGGSGERRQPGRSAGRRPRAPCASRAAGVAQARTRPIPLSVMSGQGLLASSAYTAK